MALVTDADAPALLIYTSGTTGSPKGAVITHNMLAANAINLVTCWQISDADRLHLMLPLFHVHGLGFGLHCWLVSGCVLRLEERFDHQVVERQLRDFQPTLFFGVPAMYVRLLGLGDEAARAIGAPDAPVRLGIGAAARRMCSNNFANDSATPFSSGTG